MKSPPLPSKIEREDVININKPKNRLKQRNQRDQQNPS